MIYMQMIVRAAVILLFSEDKKAQHKGSLCNERLCQAAEQVYCVLRKLRSEMILCCLPPHVSVPAGMALSEMKILTWTATKSMSTAKTQYDGVVSRMDLCFVCYEENGPAIAEKIMTPENTGFISALSVMDSVDAAAGWLMSRIIKGYQHGFRLEYPNTEFDRVKAGDILASESYYTIRMVNENDHGTGNWFDLVVVPRYMNEENE